MNRPYLKAKKVKTVTQIYKENIKRNGINTEIMKYFEEAAELQDAVSKFYAGKDTVAHIAEEIADLRIMLEQLEIIFNCRELVQEWREKKLVQLAEDVEKGD